MVDKLEAFDLVDMFRDDLNQDAAAGYILDLSQELAGLARTMALSHVAAALDRVALLAAEAYSGENAAPDDAA